MPLAALSNIRCRKVAAAAVAPLSFAGDFLCKLGNRLSGSKPVDKAFSGFLLAFLLEKLDENKNCGNHRST
jgi:hypothetical protein